MPFIKGTTKSNANRDQSKLQTSTNVATALSHIHWNVHPAQPKMQPATSVVKLTLEAKRPWRFTKETTKGKDRGQKIDNVGTDDYHLDEIDIASVSQYHQLE